LPSDEMNTSSMPPWKRARALMTVVQTLLSMSKEVEDHYSHCMLELSQASYDAFVANEQYCCLCLCEIDIMCTVTVDELEEAITVRKRVGGQIEEV
ncbi:hypothetical protein PAXRUDRAFT_162826, partial [Paxillus rubicundulus Ve08.2h10]